MSNRKQLIVGGAIALLVIALYAIALWAEKSNVSDRIADSSPTPLPEEPEAVEYETSEYDSEAAIAEFREVILGADSGLITQATIDPAFPQIGIVKVSSNWHYQPIGIRKELATGMARAWTTIAQKHGSGAVTSFIIIDSSGNQLASGTERAIANDITE